MSEPTIGKLARDVFGKDLDTLDRRTRKVLENIHAGTPISRDAGIVAEAEATFGERLADRVAAIGGSWAFIIAFGVVLGGWMLLNSGILARWNLAFDPYPYIFLNLMLSMLAAIQAPVIMMSQNRQADKDRLAARLDYEVNLRAEIDLITLHEKIDIAVAQRLDLVIARQEELAAMIAEARPARPG